MNTTVVSLLPRKLEERMAEFLADGRTGTVELNVKDGQILAWKVTESGRG